MPRSKVLSIESLSMENVIAFCIFGATTYIVFKFLQKRRRVKRHADLMEVRRLERNLNLQQIEVSFSDDTQADFDCYEAILKLRTRDLQASLSSENLSAVDVLRAFQWRACQAQKTLNCVVEFVTEANEWAMDLDTRYSSKPKPPLFGLPFCVKATLAIAGYNNSRGLGKELSVIQTEDMSLVAHLKALGAIPFCRTNFMQLLLGFSCSNPIFGKTLNPHKSNRTSGGSSGGDAALLAAGGAVFGIGSDSAGSMRIPAHFCGLTTMKSSSGSNIVSLTITGRLRVTNVHSTAYPVGFGYFARDVAFLIELYRLTWSTDYFNRVPQSIPLAYEPVSHERKLKFGYFIDCASKATPACTRAVERAVAVLKTEGHSVVPLQLMSILDIIRDFMIVVLGDNGASLLELLSDEPKDPFVRNSYRALQLPATIRRVLGCLTRPLWPTPAAFLDGCALSLADSLKASARLTEHRRAFFEQLQSQQLDAIVCPVLPMPAVDHHWPGYLPNTLCSVAIFNAFDMPAGVVPFDRVTAADDRDLVTSYPDESSHKAAFFRLRYPVEAMIREAAANSEGLPVGVQVAALPYRDELCLDIMKTLEAHAAV